MAEPAPSYAPMTPRALRLLRRPAVQTTYAELNEVNRAADSMLPTLFGAIHQHESTLLRITTRDIKGGQLMSAAEIGDDENIDPAQSALEQWSEGFLDTIDMWRENVTDYASGVTKFEVFRKSLSDDTRRSVLIALSGKAIPAMEPGATFMQLESTGVTPYLLGQLEANLALREILQIFYARHSSGTTPQSSQRWPYYVRPDSNDPLGLYASEGKRPQPNLAFFSRRDNIVAKLMAPQDTNNTPIVADDALGKVIYVDFLHRNVTTLASWEKTRALYQLQRLLLVGMPEIDRLVENALREHRSLPEALRALQQDKETWRTSPEVSAILAQEELLLRLARSPTLCTAGIYRGLPQASVDATLSTSIRHVVRRLMVARVQDVFTPGEIAFDWKAYIAAQDEIVQQKKEARAKREAEERLARTLRQAEDRLALLKSEIASPKPILLDEEEKKLDPEKAEIKRKRRERKYRQKLEKERLRTEAAIERLKEQAKAKKKISAPKPELESRSITNMRNKIRDREAREREELRQIALRAEQRQKEREASIEAGKRAKVRQEKLRQAALKPKKAKPKKPHRPRYVPVSAQERDEIRAARRWQRMQSLKRNQPQ